MQIYIICLYVHNVSLAGDQAIVSCPWKEEMDYRVRRKVFTTYFLLCNVGKCEMCFLCKINE